MANLDEEVGAFFHPVPPSPPAVRRLQIDAILETLKRIEKSGEVKPASSNGNGKWEAYTIKLLGVFLGLAIGALSWLMVDHIRVSQEQARRSTTIGRVESLERDVWQVRNELGIIQQRLKYLEGAKIGP